MIVNSSRVSYYWIDLYYEQEDKKICNRYSILQRPQNNWIWSTTRFSFLADLICVKYYHMLLASSPVWVISSMWGHLWRLLSSKICQLWRIPKQRHLIYSELDEEDNHSPKGEYDDKNNKNFLTYFYSIILDSMFPFL